MFLQLRSKGQGVAKNLTSSCTTKSPSDVTPGTGNADNNFTTVKNNKFSSKMRSDQPVIDTYNRFEEFNNPELFEEEIHEMHCPTAMTTDKDFERIRFMSYVWLNQNLKILFTFPHNKVSPQFYGVWPIILKLRCR